MNEEDFEKKLHALTNALERHDPTATWKEDILSRARRETAMSSSRRILPPRWLMLSWVTAWVAIALLSWATPQSADRDHPTNLTALPEKPTIKPTTEMNASPQTLLAFQRDSLIDNP